MKLRPWTLGLWLPALAGSVVVAGLWLPASAGRIALAQSPSPTLVDDVVAGNRVLAIEGVVDGYGHISARHATNPNRYYLARSIAPELVTAADILELDLDSKPVNPGSPATYQEAFIHGEIYKARPDVRAVVHLHAPAVIPFTVTKVPLRPMFHMAAFIGLGVPVFEIRTGAGATDMLISNPTLGRALAQALGDKPAALMRGHGAVVTGPSVPIVVGRSVYLKVNAEVQAQAMALGGSIEPLTLEESKLVGDTNGYARAWELWKRKAVR
jgi:HCOMODA/2-hydroxy-3-carboxy-muconic semialdehyde decarboxylase